MKYLFTMQSLKEATGVMVVPLDRLPNNPDELIRWVSDCFTNHYGLSIGVIEIMSLELQDIPTGQALQDILDEGMSKGNSLGLCKTTDDDLMMFSIQIAAREYGTITINN